MTDRYTDNVNGSNANSGLSVLLPKKDFSQHAINNGDQFYLKGTDVPYDNNPGDNWNLNLQLKSDVWVRRWPGFPKPIVTQTYGNGIGRAIRIGGGGTCGVEGIICQDTLETAIGDVGVAGLTLYVIDCEMYRCGVTQTGLTLGGGIVTGSTTPITNLYVYNSIIESTGRPGVYAKVTGVYEGYNCKISKTGLADMVANTGDCFEIDVAPTSYWIHGCTLDHSHKNSKQCIQQSTSNAGSQAIFEDNVLIGPSGSVAATNHKTIYCEIPAIVRRNRIVSGGYAMNLKGGGVINSNYIEINGAGAWGGANLGPILLENDLATTCDFDNNTLVLVADGSTSYAGVCAHFDATKGTGRIRNNIILGRWQAGIRRHSSAWSESFNMINGSVTPVADENLSALVRGTGTTKASPLLRGFVPDQSSRAIGAGTPIAGYTDLLGNPYKAKPSIGCIEPTINAATVRTVMISWKDRKDMEEKITLLDTKYGSVIYVQNLPGDRESLVTYKV